jgi:hypothetical protein
LQFFVVEIRKKSFADDRLSTHAAALPAAAHAFFIYVIKLGVATILTNVGARLIALIGYLILSTGSFGELL